MNAVLRKAIFDFGDAGKGLLLVGPALWHNWNGWPKYNRLQCGGGSRSHDKFGEFEAKLSELSDQARQNISRKFHKSPAMMKRGHPIMAGVSQTIKISDGFTISSRIR